MRMGLDGMIASMIDGARQIDRLAEAAGGDGAALLEPANEAAVARALTAVEEGQGTSSVGAIHESPLLHESPSATEPGAGGDGAGAVHLAPVVGITGTGGAGKSTLTDELVRRFLTDFADLHVAVLSVDPTRRRTGGALLGDRIRMNSLYGEHAHRVYMRSFATRQAHKATSAALADSVQVCQTAGFDLVIVETAGIGQSDTEVSEMVDLSLYVMTHDFGAPTQLEKIGMLDQADLVALNKFERRGSEDALRDIKKQVQRNRAAFDQPPSAMPVYPTMAARFNDPGVTRLYLALLDQLRETGRFDRTSETFDADALPEMNPGALALIPAQAPALPRRDRRDRPRLPRLGRRAGRLRPQMGPGERRRGPGRPLAAGRRRALVRTPRPDGRALVGQARQPLQSDPRRVGRASRPLPAGGVRLPGARARHQAAALPRDALRPQGAARGAPALRGPRRTPPLRAHRKPARLLPLHRRRLPPKARRRGPDAHVRRRRHARAHQPPLPPGQPRDARRPPLDRLRLRHALRPRPRPPPRHLRQGRHERREHLLAGRHEEALLRLRPLRPQNERLDDDQRPRADDPRHVPEHRHRPAGRALPQRRRPLERRRTAHPKRARRRPRPLRPVRGRRASRRQRRLRPRPARHQRAGTGPVGRARAGRVRPDRRRRARSASAAPSRPTF